MPATPATQQQMRDAGFEGAIGYRDEIALRLLCAFNGVEWQKAPPGWWVHPNESSKAAWKRVADEAKRIFSSQQLKAAYDRGRLDEKMKNAGRIACEQCGGTGLAEYP